MGEHGDREPPRRAVCLFWQEKLWLLLDGLQLLAIILSALQPFLPYGWNIWTRGLSLLLLDVPTFLRPLSTTNELGPYPLDAAGRGIVLLVLLLIVAVPAATWPRVVYAYELHERQRELDKIKKEQELQKLRRPSQARPSVTAMLACSIKAESPTFLTGCKAICNKIASHATLVFYAALGAATKLWAAVTLFCLPACLSIELPLIFCSDQADSCDSYALLAIRLASFFGVSAIFCRATFELVRDMKNATVAGQGRQQEEYIQQKELEYLLYINNDWMANKLWLVSSFKGGRFRSYFRVWLLFLKTALITSSSLLGQRRSLSPTGLGWLASLGGNASSKSVQLTASSLAEAVLQEPLGESAKTTTAAGLMLLFAVFAICRPPFRCYSSNCMHLVVFLHLVGVTGIGLAAAGTGAQTNSFLLYSNQHLLLAVVHACTFGLLCFIIFSCWICCFLPTESSLLQQYELMMGYTNKSSTRNDHAADGERKFTSFFHNFFLVGRSWCKRLFLFNGNTRRYDSWSSSGSGSTLEIGETEIKEKYYALEPFEAPWPTRHQHARFWIRVAPRLVEQLVTSSLLVKRYAAAEKQLLPVHLANAAFRDLETLVVRHIGAIEDRDTRRRSRGQTNRKASKENKQTLEEWLKELKSSPVPAVDAKVSNPLNRVDEDTQKGFEETGHEENFVFEQQASQDSLWSVDSVAAAGDDAAAIAPQTLAFRKLERAAHLSKQFSQANVEDLQHLKTITRALEWTVVEVFEKMSAIRSAAAEESIWQESAAPASDNQKLLHDFAVHLNKRKRQMALLQPVRQKLLLKLLALRFLTDTPQQREKREKEKKKQVAELFGEESSILFFAADT